MARTLRIIYSEILEEKQVQTTLNGLTQTSTYQSLLNDLTSSSKVAIWRLFYWVIAVAIYVHEQLWDEYKTEIETIAAAATPATAKWLQKESLLFQVGTNLSEVSEGKFEYSTVNSEKQIIKHCAIVESNNMVIVKVATENSSGILTPLDDDQLEQFRTYLLNYKRPAGIVMSACSYNADKVRLTGVIYYNSIKTLDDIKVYVKAAIDLYLKNLPFNGNLVINRLIDYIQEAEGITDIVLSNVECKSYNTEYVTIKPENRFYSPASGYFEFDEDSFEENFLKYLSDQV